MFEEIKSLLRRGERYIIVEHGKPVMVMLDFTDYKELAGAIGRRPAGEGSFVGPDVRTANLELAEVHPRAADFRSPAPFGPSTAPFGPAAAEFRPSAPESTLGEEPSSIRLEDLPL